MVERSAWREMTLGEVTENFDARRKPVRSADRIPGPYPYYGASGVVDNVNDYLFDGEYLLVAEDGENLRTRNTPVAFLARGKFWVNNHAHVVQANDLADTRFLAHLLAVTDISAYLTGSTQPKLSRRGLDSIRLRLPPVTLQRVFAEILGALDDKIAANAELAMKSEQLAQAIFRARVASANQVPFSSLLTPILGGTPKRSDSSFWGGENLWISATDVTGADHGVVIDTKEKISDAAVARTKAKPLPRGSVILTARGTVGAVARLAEPASFNQSAYGFRPGGLPPGVLYFSVLDAARQAANFVHGSVFDTITMRTFDDLTVPAIPPAEADALETKLSSLLDVVEHVVRENATLAATRGALLPGLISGKLHVEDAERVAESLA